ncbi:hypothetical protein NUW58_g6371 [Xylaria curta]|uniref:Uncharacterized protein n=1 Tax=Xylaria curta TaxID=42375 RepID=A0ACC1NU04_9PEZI|nr:hypothetical protein NUW58_g6371 [Xylaria curta]
MLLDYLLGLLSLVSVAVTRTLNFGSDADQSTNDWNSSMHDAQGLVTWDQYSIKVRGERVLFLSGEFHPFRLPSPGLWFDVFQKIKSLGFSGVSSYVNWALLEPADGDFRADGIFALEEFFYAASQAGLYLLMRPGPYINSEVSGGGYPGWLSRIKGPTRTNTTEWLNATRNYVQSVGAIISKAQITNGGPVILFQPENEYSICLEALSHGNTGNPKDLSTCLSHHYMAEVVAMWREAGINVPFISNDAIPIGNFVPGSGLGEVDIYGFDNYPFGWGSDHCSNPSSWNRPTTLFPTDLTNYSIHMDESPSSPFSIVEFQGGTAEPWGGAGTENCASLINHEFERVLYKVIYGFRTTIFNLYMVSKAQILPTNLLLTESQMFGGTNWGNLGHPIGYTSYDVGATIAEDRQVTREKFSELKLQANFLQVSPAYLTAIPQESRFGQYANTTKLVTTALIPTEQGGAFYIVRHSDWTSKDTVKYKLSLLAGGQNVTVPQLGGSLSLTGRDSKIHVVDYDVSSGTVLVLYGGEGETHEFAIKGDFNGRTKIEGDGIRTSRRHSSTIIQWDVKPSRQVVHFGQDLQVHLLWRNDAYNYWVLDLPRPEPTGNYISASRINATDASVVVKAGYLMRNATVSDNTLHLRGDVNKTTTIEVISSPLGCGAKLFFNGKSATDIQCIQGRLTGIITYQKPEFALPDLKALDWRYLDSLPEIQDSYDDSGWRTADLDNTNSTRALTTPVSLYAGDYGFHSGSLIYRGSFKGTGNESSLYLSTSGGMTFSHAVWLNSTFLGSWPGDPKEQISNQTFTLPSKLQQGGSYVITVLIDHMGLSQSFLVGLDGVKDPRGILDYQLSDHPSQSDVTWKLTGNLGGEYTHDRSRGPMNEGAMFAERQGFHLPNAPLDGFERKSPITDGVTDAGVGFFVAEFDLDIPPGYDVPSSLNFRHATNRSSAPAYRVQFFVNGWQFGKYGMRIPLYKRVPEGILNHNGKNELALTLWSLEPSGVKIEELSLEANAMVQSSYSKPYLVHGQGYTKRLNAY